MKSVNLKIAKEKVSGRDMYFNTYEILKMAVNNPPQGGLGVEEMGKRLRILSKLEEFKADFEIEEKDYSDALLTKTALFELEDADFEKLKVLFDESKWGVISHFIVELHEEIKKA